MLFFYYQMEMLCNIDVSTTQKLYVLNSREDLILWKAAAFAVFFEYLNFSLPSFLLEKKTLFLIEIPEEYIVLSRF